MKNYIVNSILLFITSITILSAQVKPQDWEIAAQAYSFKDFTLEETLENLELLDIKFIEMYRKQQISSTDKTFTNFDMSKEKSDKVQMLLKKHGIKLSSYGVISPKKKNDWEVLFKFAKKMGIETIVSEPIFDQVPMVDELCKKYDIKLAIHNHATPTKYWDPATVKSVLKGRSNYIRVCADIGHWKRSGLDVAKSLKMLKGHIHELHLKDVDKPSTDATIVPLGTGIIKWNKVFKELKRQHFKGKMVIEHTAKKEVLMDDMKLNVEFLKTNIK
ncbi:sugar phosphate isomerase/epimerase family protein [Lutibacter citreus]|uniref:sugar phosphate isomerase/epimerase family protein n=1 Tax=Lutibacter citreus TaxID=2138210 RepID=UPI000DBE4F91|nr:sugar phosphate isomerase/epimerase [Lutibacter citreus]